MFVYQSNEMQKLYRRHTPTLLLLDATYRTTKYSSKYSSKYCLKIYVIEQSLIINPSRPVHFRKLY